MEYRRLADEYCNLHFTYAKEFTSTVAQLFEHGELRALLYICKKNEAVAPGELAEELRISSGRIANILKNLEKKKYIIRGRSGEDRRKVLVTVTDAGVKCANKEYEIYRDRFEGVLREMGEDDAKELLHLFKKALQISGKVINSEC